MSSAYSRSRVQILIVDDDAVTRSLVEGTLCRAGYDVISADSGTAAAALWQEHQISLVLTDWTMPGLDGEGLCRLIRATPCPHYTYIIMLTAKETREDMLKGLAAGADDYLMKPYDPAELLMRVQSGLRVITLETTLRQRVSDLEAALTHIQQLEEILPICAYCKQIRDEAGQWHEIEVYIQDRTETAFSHGICPACLQTQMETSRLQIQAAKARSMPPPQVSPG